MDILKDAYEELEHNDRAHARRVLWFRVAVAAIVSEMVAAVILMRIFS